MLHGTRPICAIEYFTRSSASIKANFKNDTYSCKIVDFWSNANESVLKGFAIQSVFIFNIFKKTALKTRYYFEYYYVKLLQIVFLNVKINTLWNTVQIRFEKHGKKL